MKNNRYPAQQRGVSLVELMITLVITLFLVSAAAYVYLGTRETQRAIERNSSSREIGTFTLELLGRDIMNAGFYPTIEQLPQPAGSAYRRFSSSAYPPNDWTPTTPVYLTGIFGCEGASFNPADGTCGTPSDTDPDTIVINYFTSDPSAMRSQTGTRFDCTGANVEKDGGNNGVRGANPGTPSDNNLPPGLPLFGSNRYTLANFTTTVEGQSVGTRQLVCSGNGGGNSYQPLLLGLEDLQFSYAVYNSAADASRVPDRFYTAREISENLLPITVEGRQVAPWARVVAVRICLMTRSMGAAPKIADAAGTPQTYVNCQEQTVSNATGDMSLHKRYVQVFGVRNNLNLSY